MQEFVLILMLKKNGIVEKELCTVKIAGYGGLLRDMFVEETEGVLMTHIRVTLEGDINDWQYDAIYDYYDSEIFDGLQVGEIHGDINPVWEIVFPYIDNPDKLSNQVSGILNIHKRELDGVFEAIKEVEGEYYAL